MFLNQNIGVFETIRAFFALHFTWYDYMIIILDVLNRKDECLDLEWRSQIIKVKLTYSIEND